MSHDDFRRDCKKFKQNTSVAREPSPAVGEKRAAIIKRSARLSHFHPLGGGSTPLATTLIATCTLAVALLVSGGGGGGGSGGGGSDGGGGGGGGRGGGNGGSEGDGSGGIVVVVCVYVESCNWVGRYRSACVTTDIQERVSWAILKIPELSHYHEIRIDDGLSLILASLS